MLYRLTVYHQPTGKYWFLFLDKDCQFHSLGKEAGKFLAQLNMAGPKALALIDVAEAWCVENGYIYHHASIVSVDPRSL